MPGDTRKRIKDGDELCRQLFVKGGSHGWRFPCCLASRRNILSLSTYPDVRLSQARKLVSHGTDPSNARKAREAAALEKVQAECRADGGLPASGSFEAVAREWFDTRRDGLVCQLRRQDHGQA